MSSRFETYQRNDGLIDWRLKAANADVIATSHTQGFRDRTDAERSIRGVAYAILDMLTPEDVLAGGAIDVVDLEELRIVHLEPGELGMTPGGEENDATTEAEGDGTQAGAEEGDTEADTQAGT